MIIEDEETLHPDGAVRFDDEMIIEDVPPAPDGTSAAEHEKKAEQR